MAILFLRNGFIKSLSDQEELLIRFLKENKKDIEVGELFSSLEEYEKLARREWDKIITVSSLIEEPIQAYLRFYNGRNYIWGVLEGKLYNSPMLVKQLGLFRIIAVSRFVKRILGELGIKVRRIIKHGLDLNLFRSSKEIKDIREIGELEIGELPDSFRTSKAIWQELEGRKIYLTIANASYRKRLDILGEVITKVNRRISKEERRELAFLLITDIDLAFRTFPKLRKAFIENPNFFIIDSRYSLPKKIILLLYQFSYCYLNTSQSEGFCLPILEAAAFKKPSITPALYPIAENFNRNEAFFIPIKRSGQYYYAFSQAWEINNFRTSKVIDLILLSLRNEDLVRKVGELAYKKALKFDYRLVFRPFLKLLE